MAVYSVEWVNGWRGGKARQCAEPRNPHPHPHPACLPCYKRPRRTSAWLVQEKQLRIK